MPFLRGTTPIWSTQDLHVVSNNGKLVWWKSGKTAHKLEKQNARANFPWQRT